MSALIIGALIVVLCTSWILVERRLPVQVRRTTKMRKVDVAALRNLTSREEDLFLRSSLSAAHYRAVRRSRLRAIQEYLLWIAGNCAAIIELLRMESANSENHLNVSEAAKKAAKLRVMCLGYWCLLWADYLVPDLNVRPLQVIRRYEDLWRFTQTSLLTQVDAAAIPYSGV